MSLIVAAQLLSQFCSQPFPYSREDRRQKATLIYSDNEKVEGEYEKQRKTADEEEAYLYRYLPLLPVDLVPGAFPMSAVLKSPYSPGGSIKPLNQ